MTDQPRTAAILGYFDSPAQTVPAFDPGLNVPDLVCWRPLREQPRVTVALMWADGDRSYFFRSHKACWNALSLAEQERYEGSLLP